MKTIEERDILQIRELLLNVLDYPSFQTIERLGGLTNHTYHVKMSDGNEYVVRLPGEGTEELINRSNEKVSTQLACDLGIDAQLLYFGNKGEKLTRYITGAETLCAESFKDDANLQKAAKILSALHTSGVDTKVPFDVFDMAAGYEKIIIDNNVALFDDYENIKEQVMRIRSYTDKHAKPTAVPCHNDPLCENWVLDKNGTLYLIDWEYAGMNDGMWDLADVSIEANFSAEQDTTFLFYYFGRRPDQEEITRFHANKLYLDFLWALWGKARVPFDGPDMEQYGQERYERLKQNLKNFEHLPRI